MNLAALAGAASTPLGGRKPSSGITPTLKRSVWEFYMGIGVQKALCSMCGINTISNNINSGFECAHVVARNFFYEELNVYYLFPACAVCNNQCRDMCVWDFMYARGRLGPLRKAVLGIYKVYLVEHEHELAPQDRMAHLILDHLYGPKRFPVGGGIQNTKQIYEIARAEQYEFLREQSLALERQLEEIQVQRRQLLEVEIKPMRLI
jgi:hypothetical protein